MQFYCESLTEYKRLKTREVRIGDLLLGNNHPIRIQTMTTTDTMDTLATVEQSIRCIEAGAELVRITAPSKNEAENLFHIKNELRKRGYKTPLVADIHFTPNAAEIAARIVEKVRINPGNYVDKKKFELLEYSDADYAEELVRIRNRFLPLISLCKEYGTAMRIGTNHGSLSDRIMSRYGDTPMGMVESAMEFLRVARDENYHNIVLSMKSSNPLVMVEAYRLLVKTMLDEFGECYPLHLGVTEAGDGEDGRIKSAVGIGTLLEDGLGDTIRVSLTEEPEAEIPVCRELVKRYQSGSSQLYSSQSDSSQSGGLQSGSPQLGSLQPGGMQTAAAQVVSQGGVIPEVEKLPYDPFSYQRRKSFAIDNIGGEHVPIVIADLSKLEKIYIEDLAMIGYSYDAASDKWTISDRAADFAFTGNHLPDFPLPGSLKLMVYPATWQLVQGEDKGKIYYPIFDGAGYLAARQKHDTLNFVMLDCFNDETPINDFTYLDELGNDSSVVICLGSTNKNGVQSVRRMYIEFLNRNIQNPVINNIDSRWDSQDEHLVHFATEAGALLLDGFGDGLFLGMQGDSWSHLLEPEKFVNDTAFNILQATRTRISKTEYISCPSCGRTLFDLQETTAKIRSVTHHLKGVKIAIMGCIVNGPGEMADADFGYVGSGPGKITLYKGKEIIKRNVNSDVAVDELINLIKQNNAWVEPSQ